MPFIDELLQGINTIICDLQPQQVKLFGIWRLKKYLTFAIFRFKHFTRRLVI